MERIIGLGLESFMMVLKLFMFGFGFRLNCMIFCWFWKVDGIELEFGWIISVFVNIFLYLLVEVIMVRLILLG